MDFCVYNVLFFCSLYSFMFFSSSRQNSAPDRCRPWRWASRQRVGAGWTNVIRCGVSQPELKERWRRREFTVVHRKPFYFLKTPQLHVYLPLSEEKSDKLHFGGQIWGVGNVSRLHGNEWRAVQEETKSCWWTNVMMECCSESPLVDVLALNWVPIFVNILKQIKWRKSIHFNLPIQLLTCLMTFFLFLSKLPYGTDPSHPHFSL